MIMIIFPRKKNMNTIMITNTVNSFIDYNYNHNQPQPWLGKTSKTWVFANSESLAQSQENIPLAEWLLKMSPADPGVSSLTQWSGTLSNPLVRLRKSLRGWW